MEQNRAKTPFARWQSKGIHGSPQPAVGHFAFDLNIGIEVKGSAASQTEEVLPRIGPSETSIVG